MRMLKHKPLSASALLLKAKLAAGEESQMGLADYLRCDQTTISKWFSNGATPSLAMAVRIEERWPEITARGWLDIVVEFSRYKPRETKGGARGKLGKTGSGRGGP